MPTVTSCAGSSPQHCTVKRSGGSKYHGIIPKSGLGCQMSSCAQFQNTSGTLGFVKLEWEHWDVRITEPSTEYWCFYLTTPDTQLLIKNWVEGFCYVLQSNILSQNFKPNKVDISEDGGSCTSDWIKYTVKLSIRIHHPSRTIVLAKHGMLIYFA